MYWKLIAASRTKVEDTRELLDNVPYAPSQGRYKIYIIDEVHMLSNHSFNALLKTLEEPPEHVKFLFATTDPQKLPITILSRCIQFQLNIFNDKEICEYLQKTLSIENIEFEPMGLDKLSNAAKGSMRDALTLLEQVISFGEGKVSYNAVVKIIGVVNNNLLMELLTAIVNNLPQQAFDVIKNLQQEIIDFQQVLQELLALLHKVAIMQVLPDYVSGNDLEKSKLLELAKSITPESIQVLYQICMYGNKDLIYTPDPKLGFEMVILRMLAFQPIYSMEYVEAGGMKQKFSKNSEVSRFPEENKKNFATKLDPKVLTKTQKTNNFNGDNKKQVKSNGINIASQEQEQEHENDTFPNWGELIYNMQLTGLTKVVAQHCSITSWKKNSVVLSLDPVHKALLQQHHEKRLQEALQKYLKRELKLNIILGQSIADAPAKQYRDQQSKQQKEAEDLIKNNEKVKEIINTFDAKLERVVIKDNV